MSWGFQVVFCENFYFFEFFQVNVEFGIAILGLYASIITTERLKSGKNGSKWHKTYEKRKKSTLWGLRGVGGM